MMCFELEGVFSALLLAMFFALCYHQNQRSAIFTFVTIGSYSELLRRTSAVPSLC